MRKDKNKNISIRSGRQTTLGIIGNRDAGYKTGTPEDQTSKTLKAADQGASKPGLQTETRAGRRLEPDKNVVRTIRTAPYSYQFIQGKGAAGDMKAEDDGKRVEVCTQRRVLAATGDEFYTIAFFYPTGAVYYPYDCKFAECAEAQGWLDKMAKLYKWKPFDPPLKLKV